MAPSVREHAHAVPPNAAHLFFEVSKLLATIHPRNIARSVRKIISKKVPDREPDRGIVIPIKSAATKQTPNFGCRQARVPFRLISRHAKLTAVPRQSRAKADQ